MSQSALEEISQKERLELEEALNNSEAATNPDNYRKLPDAQHAAINKNFYKATANNESAAEESLGSPKAKRAPKRQADAAILTLADFPNSRPNYKTIFHEPVFDLPITLDPKLNRLTVKHKVALLCNHFSKVDKFRAEAAHRCFVFAPWPKPVLPSNKCTEALLKNDPGDEMPPLEEMDQTQEVYTSRAGRQIKRKVYTEVPDIDSNDSSDYTVPLKKTKDFDSDVKITLDVPVHIEDTYSTPSKASTSLKKDSFKKYTPTTRKFTSRSEQLFDKLVETNDKKKEQDEEIQLFQNTLNVEDSDDELVLQASPVKASQEEFFPKIRVTPPLPALKKGRTKKAKPPAEDLDRIDVVAEPSNSRKKTKTTSATSRTQKGRENEVQEQPCPICNEMFSQTEIANHAASCGEDDPFLMPSQEHETQQCNVCKLSFKKGTTYENHFKVCIASLIGDA